MNQELTIRGDDEEKEKEEERNRGAKVEKGLGHN